MRMLLYILIDVYFEVSKLGFNEHGKALSFFENTAPAFVCKSDQQPIRLVLSAVHLLFPR